MFLLDVRTVLRAGQWRRPFVLVTVVAVLVVVLAAPNLASAQSGAFTGPYVGFELSRQHVIGGSLVDGVDTLQEDVRLVASGIGGVRGALGRLVIGGEVGLGHMDGNLVLADPARSLSVSYASSRQWHWAVMTGPAINARTWLYTYLSEVTREFVVDITRNNMTVAQKDEQGMLRFGLGVERRLSGSAHLRVAAGTSRADFGGRRTNIEPGRRLELGVTALWQF